jgi:hypothetical protein
LCACSFENICRNISHGICTPIPLNITPEKSEYLIQAEGHDNQQHFKSDWLLERRKLTLDARVLVREEFSNTGKPADETFFWDVNKVVTKLTTQLLPQHGCLTTM